jgi:hypothetical protein
LLLHYCQDVVCRKLWQEKQLFLYVDAENHATLRLYIRCGFVPIRLEKGPLRKEPDKKGKYSLLFPVEDSVHLNLEHVRQEELFSVFNKVKGCDTGDENRDNAFINAWKSSQELSIHLSDNFVQRLSLNDRVLLRKDL